MPSGVTLNVGGLEIAVNDALLMRSFERLGDLGGESDRFIHREGAPRESVGQRFAVQELEDERRDPVRLLDAVDGGDVRMAQRGEETGLTRQPRAPPHVGDERGGQRLERHLPAELFIAPLQTSPMPPWPMADSTSYGPIRIPGARDISRAFYARHRTFV
jgi:hypothetical protein